MLGKEILHVAQCEAEVEPDRVLDNRRRIAVVAIGAQGHAQMLFYLPFSRSNRFRDDALRFCRRTPTSALRHCRTRSRNSIWGIEVPGILGQADKVADRLIGGPSTAERYTRQILRHTGFQKRSDVGCRSNRSAVNSPYRGEIGLRDVGWVAR